MGFIAGIVAGLLALAGLIVLLLVHLYWRRPDKAPAEVQPPSDTAAGSATTQQVVPADATGDGSYETQQMSRADPASPDREDTGPTA